MEPIYMYLVLAIIVWLNSHPQPCYPPRIPCVYTVCVSVAFLWLQITNYLPELALTNKS